MRRYLKLVLPVMLAVALVGCSGGSKSSETTSDLPSGTQEAPLSGKVILGIKNFKHAPGQLFVKKGTIIEVTNDDLVGHSVTAQDGSFDTGIISNGSTVSLTMDTVGAFGYHCTPHPNMTGTITVVE